MEISMTPPTAAEFLDLYLTTGWGEPTLERCERALEGSWAVCSARDDDGALVGVARVVSDGAMHAYVNEMIVRPDRQGSGVGAAIVAAIVRAVQAAGITQVQLFAAAGRAGFYERHGFVARPADAPGMDLSRDS